MWLEKAVEVLVFTGQEVMETQRAFMEEKWD